MKVLKTICKSKQYKKRLGIEEECPKTYLLLEERAHSLRVERLVPTMSYDQVRVKYKLNEMQCKVLTLLFCFSGVLLLSRILDLTIKT